MSTSKRTALLGFFMASLAAPAMAAERRTTMSTSKRTALLGFFMASLAAPAMAAEGEGAAAAVAPEKPSGEPTKMFIGGGIGPALNPRYKVNGKTITFSDQFQGATDKISPIALSVSFGLALNPRTFVGFEGSLASQIGKIAGTDTHVQINNYFAGVTYFPWETGPYLRAGAGLSSFVATTGSQTESSGGLGFLLGAGYALRVVGGHHLSIAYTQTWQSYGGMYRS